MAGIASDSNGFQVLYADNIDFSGSLNPQASILTDGQLSIGSTALPHIRPGFIVAADTSIVVGYSGPNITLKAVGGGAVGTLISLTPDSGGLITGTAGNINVFGVNPSFATVTDTINSTASPTGNLQIENRAWLTGLVVDSSSTAGTRGTFSTISAALTAAVSGQTIFIRTGTYTENLTLKAGVNLTAFTCDAFTPNVTIVGKLTATFAGTASISGIQLKTNSDFFLAITGSNATIINLINCYLNVNNNTGISYTTSSASAILNILYCQGDTGTTGIAYFALSAAGDTNIKFCDFFNSGASTTANTASAANLNMEQVRLNMPITTSSTNNIVLRNCIINSAATNTTALTLGGSGLNVLIFTRMLGGSASAISVSTSCQLYQCDISSSNTNAGTGVGTIQWALLTFSGTSTLINTTTQQPQVFDQGSYQTIKPAGNYTVLNSDYFIGVDTSANRTITLPASSKKGEFHIIKDITGTANAHNITVGGGGNNIDGAANFTINTNYGSISLISDGTNWFIL